MTHEIFDLGDITLQSGATLTRARLAYKTFGTLSPARDNVIVYPTSFAATHDDATWLIGPGRALDPRKYFIIVPDAFANGLSSSPSNTPAPQHGRKFPALTLHDNVLQQRRLLSERFGVERVRLAVGWSLGGAQAFEWAATFPDSVERLFAFQSAARTSRHFHVFFDSVRMAIELDPAFRQGAYTQPPERGLRAAARVYAAWGFSQAFFRRHLDQTALGYSSLEAFLVEFWEAWFLARDANDIIAQLRSGQGADISANSRYHGDFAKALAAIKADTLLMPSSSDLYFPVADAELEARGIPNAELRVLQTDWGHVAGEGLNQTDTRAIEQAITDLLGR
ncbi:alpha/beta fold hydrolase [Pseudomonas sp. BW16M2]|uniref:alpha/beta fold hydrolase n=1 Tax=Pseudomonas sp. BW16M2 TaxID=2745489 RepID=UPI001644DA95|nr:alpha/beta fold hydrolase [Pseudomonas sp. BW16M2]MBC3437735.1 alpha/beta fold hydrolase [Pseudomonas sp. BW16M2]MBI6896461.1 alpha/beta fold hydrolase [Pseudomonas putida]